MEKYSGILFVLSIFVAAALVVAADVVLAPILLEFYFQTSVTILFVYDFSVVLFAGLGGMFVASRVGCPFWWRPSNSASVSRRATYITVFLALVIVAGNTLMNLVYAHESAQLAPWLDLLTPETAAAISLRAALNEEIVFRFFLFPSLALVIRYLVHSQRASLVISALISAILVGITHAGFVLAFLLAFPLVYIYYRRGLLPAIAVHFFADAIPFLLISMTP